MAVPDDSENELLAGYQSLLENARLLNAVAQEGRWDDLPDLDNARQLIQRKLIKIDQTGNKAASVEQIRIMIHAIIECDEQTKSLILAWQNEITQLLGSIDNERKLSHVYRGA